MVELGFVCAVGLNGEVGQYGNDILLEVKKGGGRSLEEA